VNHGASPAQTEGKPECSSEIQKAGVTNSSHTRLTWSKSLKTTSTGLTARFVQMIIDRELVVSKRKKADIVAELRSLKFRPFPRVSEAREAGEEIEA